jgi:hypothetical protein
MASSSSPPSPTSRPSSALYIGAGLDLPRALHALEDCSNARPTTTLVCVDSRPATRCPAFDVPPPRLPGYHRDPAFLPALVALLCDDAAAGGLGFVLDPDTPLPSPRERMHPHVLRFVRSARCARGAPNTLLYYLSHAFPDDLTWDMAIDLHDCHTLLIGNGHVPDACVLDVLPRDGPLRIVCFPEAWEAAQATAAANPDPDRRAALRARARAGKRVDVFEALWVALPEDPPFMQPLPDVWAMGGPQGMRRVWQVPPQAVAPPGTAAPPSPALPNWRKRWARWLGWRE